MINISGEALQQQPDLMGQIQRQQTNALIARERAALAEVSSWQLAWEVYLPTKDDNAEDWAPYLTRLTDL